MQAVARRARARRSSLQCNQGWHQILDVFYAEPVTVEQQHSLLVPVRKRVPFPARMRQQNPNILKRGGGVGGRLADVTG